MRDLVAELLGTYCLVFAGTGAIIVEAERPGTVTHVGISLTFGLIVTAMIYTFGGISGAHINPASTLSAWLAGRIRSRLVPGYVAAQCIGAILASLSLQMLFPENKGLGGTLPHGSPWQSFGLEIFLTFLLMLTCLRTTVGVPAHTALAGWIIGGVVALEALFAGPICGASMNPARSLGPALVSGNWQHFWIYVSAPALGAALAAGTDRWLGRAP